MDILDRIIKESINRLVLESESENDADAKSKSDDVFDNIGDSSREEQRKKSKRDGGREVTEGERIKLKKWLEDNFIKIADIAYQVYPDHTPEGAQSQLEKQINGERPLRYREYNIIKKLVGLK